MKQPVDPDEIKKAQQREASRYKVKSEDEDRVRCGLADPVAAGPGKKPSHRVKVDQEIKVTKEDLEQLKRVAAPRVAAGLGRKDDQGKLGFHLVPWDAMVEVVKVLDKGAEKYGPGNWAHVEGTRYRYFAACMRHIIAWWGGEDIDPQWGLSHLAHAICSLLFLLALHKRKKEEQK